MSGSSGRFEYACFISYKHPPTTACEDHFYREFVKCFRERLEFYLVTKIRSYLDLDADPGSSYPTELSQKLCKSVCMIAVLVPEYADSNWCQAEWKAMEKLETRRLGEGRRGLIIPVALRRTAAEWNALVERSPVDFSKVSVPKEQLASVRHSEKIQRIAEIINRLASQVEDTGEECDQFELGAGQEELNPDPIFKDPSPFS